MSKVKISVTLDETLSRELDRLARQLETSRSRVVEEAIRFWQRKRKEAALIEGYQAMAPADTETAESNLPAAFETLR